MVQPEVEIATRVKDKLRSRSRGARRCTGSQWEVEAQLVAKQSCLEEARELEQKGAG